MNALIYDCEIVKAVPSKKEAVIPGIEYCEGWNDHAGMGISVICAYDYVERRFRVFTKENWSGFADLLERSDVLVGFNNIGFDNKLIRANGVTPNGSEWERKSYDILAEMWEASGLSRTFQYPTHAGFSLDNTAMLNLREGKTGNGGAMAPVEWQRGNVGMVIDYCLQDIRLTKGLFDRIISNGGLRSPKVAGTFLEMRNPSR